MPAGEPGWRCRQPYGPGALRLQGGSPDLRVLLPWRQGGSQAQRFGGGLDSRTVPEPRFCHSIPMVGPGLKCGCSCLAWRFWSSGVRVGPHLSPSHPLVSLRGCGDHPVPPAALDVSVGQAPIPPVGQASIPSGFGPALRSGADPNLLARQIPIPHGADPNSHCSRPSPHVCPHFLFRASPTSRAAAPDPLWV